MQAAELTVGLATLLRSTMGSLPSAVAILTARDPVSDEPVGMVVSSVISASLDPPSMAVAVNQSAAIHRCLAARGRFCISFLNVEQRDLVPVFSTWSRRAERFAGPGWQELHGLDYLEGAVAVFCNVSGSIVCGTHEIFVGEVTDVQPTADFSPLAWMNGGCHGLSPLAVAES